MLVINELLREAPLSLSIQEPVSLSLSSDMGSTNPLDSVGLDDTPQHRSHHYQQRSPDMRHRSSKAREAVTALSQQTVSVMKVQTEVEEYAETSVTVKVRDLYPVRFFNLFGLPFLASIMNWGDKNILIYGTKCPKRV